MFASYVWADLVRNPRRTLSTAVGVMLGVGLACAVLFFVDGLSASMTQNALAPLAIDMQRVLTAPVAGDVRLRLKVEPAGPAKAGDVVKVLMEVRNNGATPANEVVVRSLPTTGLSYVNGSALVGGKVVAPSGDDPFASGPAKVGLNIGTVAARSAVSLEYRATVSSATDISQNSFLTTYSTREALTPIPANSGRTVNLPSLVSQIRAVPGIAFAEQLSFADLPQGALTAKVPVGGAVRVFGFDAGYTRHDGTIAITRGVQKPGEAMISAEAARALGVGPGDAVSLHLPDGTVLKTQISAVVDLTRARSLFSSRQGANLETFAYVPDSLVLDPATFAGVVVPALERAAANRSGAVQSPLVREVDIGVKRALLDATPSVALGQTKQIAKSVSSVAGGQDFLLDNISNTLEVASADAMVAKRMFVFLGVPGALLAAMLAAYAGVVLAGAQRREQATLRIRGASRRDLLSMLALRVGLITAAGAVVGVALGYLSAAAVIGQSALSRATTASLVTSALLGTTAGLLATGAALYITGRRSIDREISEDRAQLYLRPPAWRRYRLDLAGMALVLVATVIVLATSGFKGTPGSVYVGRAVALPLWLLFLPIGAWIAGSLMGARVFALLLARRHVRTPVDLDRPLSLLYRLSIRRRSWALADAAVIVGLIVALGTSLAIFTASYDRAKAADARYVVGSDLKVTPNPAAKSVYLASDAHKLAVNGVDAVTPVVYSVYDVVLRSNRTSDVANMAAVDPAAYRRVAPLDNAQFSNGSASESLRVIARRPDAILLSTSMADFLQARVGDTLWVLLARGTPQQVDVKTKVVGLFERLPGFPDGADALMNIVVYEKGGASTAPNFFLVQTSDPSNAALGQVATTIRNGPGARGALQVDTRLSALAKDQSSLAALNIGGLLQLDSGYALAMGTVTMAIFVFGLLLQRRREYVTLRAQGMAPRAIRTLITAEAGTVALAGCVSGVVVGLMMAYYFVNVLRPLYVLNPPFHIPFGTIAVIVGSVLLATAITSVAASSLVNRLKATELLRDE